MGIRPHAVMFYGIELTIDPAHEDSVCALINNAGYDAYGTYLEEQTYSWDKRDTEYVYAYAVPGYDMPCLVIVNPSEVKWDWDDGVKRIEPEQLMSFPHWDEMIEDFCREHKLNYTKPGWHVVAYMF